MDPLLAHCRRTFAARHAETVCGWSKNHAAVALALWTHAHCMSPRDHGLLVQTFDRDPEARDDSSSARRRRVDAETIVLRLFPVLLAAEIEHHHSPRLRLSLFAVLIDLDFGLARQVWQRSMTGRTTLADLAPLLSARSREAREWAMSLLGECAPA